MPLFQSNLRKQIRKLPKILQFVKIIHYYSELFTSLVSVSHSNSVSGISGSPEAGAAWASSTTRAQSWICDLRAVPDPGSTLAGSLPSLGAHRRHGIRQTLEGSFSAVSRPNFASKYSLESSRRDLHNALLCTVLGIHNRKLGKKNLAKTTPKR